MFKSGIITTKGSALDAKVKAGQTIMAFTQIKTGSGKHEPSADLKKVTVLKELKQEFPISSKLIINNTTVRFRTIIKNEGVTEGYYIREMGLYANDPDEGEILYSVFIGLEEKLEYQPSETELKGSLFTLDTYTTVSSTEAVAIEIFPGIYAPAEDFDELKGNMKNLAFKDTVGDADIIDVDGTKVTQDAAHRFVTDTDQTNWKEAFNKRHEHTNKGILDKITQGLLDNWSAAYTHIGDAVKHTTAAERANWNTVANKVDQVAGKQLSTNDYTAAEKAKLSGMAAGAEVNVQPDWSVTDTAMDAFIKNKPASLPASDVKAWAKADIKPSYGWAEVTGKPTTFAPSPHTHTKSQIPDMPTKVSQFANDSGFITSADVDSSQNHTHANKTVLDKATQAMLDKLSGIAEGANQYIHPTTAGNHHIPAGGATGQFLKWSADGTAVWGADNNTAYSAFKGAAASAAGGAGLVPAPEAGAQAKYLRADGSWQTPPDTNTTYGAATTSSAGLMPAADKAKLDRSWSVKTATLTAAGWSAAAPFTQTVTAAGITAADTPIVSLRIADGTAAATVKAQNKAYGCVDRAVTGAGNITFTCYNKKPAADFTVAVKGV